MSKIYDALTKVQQERRSTEATDDAISNELDPTIALREELASSLVEPHPGTNASPRVVNSEDLLRFQKFVERCAKPEWTFDPNTVFLTEASSSTMGAEQFRTLRARLDKIRETKPLKKMQVTSAISGEGKSFVATNLAHAISRQHDRRVLLIDGDLRRSTLHLSLGAPPSPGLSEYLLGEADEADVVQHGKDGNLCFIPGGKQVTDPSELLSKGRLKGLFDRMSPIFDWIIVDSPPCLPVADAIVISRLCDGVLMVVRAAATPSALSRKANLELKGRNVVGVVLNAVSEPEHQQAFYPYGYGSPTSQSDQKP
jgi:capsular exopolysaccharide synthesis family protein